MQLSRAEVFFGIWHVPVVKRTLAIIALLCFVVLTIVVAFQPLCGPVNYSHLMFVGWVVAMIVQEREHTCISAISRVYLGHNISCVYLGRISA